MAGGRLTSLNVFFFSLGCLCSFLCVSSCIWWGIPPPQGFKSYKQVFIWGVPIGLFFSMNAMIGIVSLHISTYQISKYHTVSSVFTQYMFSLLQWLFSGRGTRDMERIWRDPQEEQTGLFTNKMKQDANTDYGKKHNFAKITSIDEFRQRHPLTRYDHYREYMLRISKGESDVLTSESLKRFGITSGTTGQTKMIQMMPSRGNVALKVGMTFNAIVSENFSKTSPLQKWMTTYTAPRPLWTESGLLAGPMNMYTEQQKRFVSIYTSPVSAFCIIQEYSATYIHLLFSIRDPATAVWITSSTSHVRKAISLLKANWNLMLKDLSSGTLNNDLRISEYTRKDLEAALSPEPTRAAQLKKEFEKGFDGIIARIWPQMSHIVAVDIEGITKQLHSTYAKGVPIYSAAYAAAEAEIGLNLWPKQQPSKYALLPNSALYEFIPEETCWEEQPKTLLLHEVEKGQSYEIVLTTSNGLCRYRLGDVVKVVDFHRNTPAVEFCYRTGQVLNLCGENMTEILMQNALKNAVKKWAGVHFEQWSCAESSLLAIDLEPPKEAEGDDKLDIKESLTKSLKQTRDVIERPASEMFYLIFMELSGQPVTMDDQHINQVDKQIRNQCEQYRTLRESGTVTSPHVMIVRPGTFLKLEEYMVAHTATSHNQFKIPRKISGPHILRYLVDASMSIEKVLSSIIFDSA